MDQQPILRRPSYSELALNQGHTRAARSANLEDRRAESSEGETDLSFLASLLSSLFGQYHEGAARVHADKMGGVPDVSLPEWWGKSPEEVEQYFRELREMEEDY